MLVVARITPSSGEEGTKKSGIDLLRVPETLGLFPDFRPLVYASRYNVKGFLMSDTKVTSKHLSYLSDYDLLTVYASASRIIKKRGLNKKLIDRPTELKKVKGSPLYPRRLKAEIPSKEFERIMLQDWSYLFDSRLYDQSKNYYVYIHTDPRNQGTSLIKEFFHIGSPFYVGKGKASRYLSRKRNKPHRDLITEILGYGFDLSEIAKIYKSGLTELEALILESKLITYFGCRNEIGQLKHKYINGHKRGLLINTDTGVRPKEYSEYIASIRKK